MTASVFCLSSASIKEDEAVFLIPVALVLPVLRVPPSPEVGPCCSGFICDIVGGLQRHLRQDFETPAAECQKSYLGFPDGQTIQNHLNVKISNWAAE